MLSLRIEIVATNNIMRNIKKEQGTEPCSKNCVDPLCPRKFEDLLLIVEATLLERVRAPPETWTTKLCLSASLSLES
jgi:hypothetical protein